jgi:hypothetical protein
VYALIYLNSWPKSLTSDWPLPSRRTSETMKERYFELQVVSTYQIAHIQSINAPLSGLEVDCQEVNSAGAQISTVDQPTS